jgi:UDP-N-acetylmuramoyl-L-alanyl-D-glutamate--2,6-diaminopimelate ligase
MQKTRDTPTPSTGGPPEATGGPGSAPGHRALGELAAAAGIDGVAPEAAGVPVRRIATDSRDVGPGALFVALPGTRTDGHAYADEAVESGAVAMVAEAPCPTGLRIPCLQVDDARRTLARLAAEWYGRPADRLRLAGITGTVGKTSVLAMMEAILRESDVHVGAIGSLGVSVEGEAEPTGYTAPDPLLLHEGLARIAADGARLAVMEVTSHALVQERVHGLEYALGVFTNLMPLEHADYHATFASYVEAKSRFFDHLEPGAPLVHNHDDLAVRNLAAERDVEPIGCGCGADAHVRVEALEIGPGGTSFRLVVRRPLPRLDGAPLAPQPLDVRMRALGRASAINAALAATAALVLGAKPEAALSALAAFPPARRRVEVIHDGRFRVLDDTVGHPDSVSAIFEVVAALAAERLHVAFVVRGQRGPDINHGLGEALAIWAEKHPPGTLVVTRSADAADARNRVTDEEQEAFVAPLRAAGIAFQTHETLDAAVPAVLERAGEGDLVLLLGAQGMDGGAERALRWLEAHGQA